MGDTGHSNLLDPLDGPVAAQYTVISSTLTKSVNPEEVGGTLGLSASLESLTPVIAPSLGGYLLGRLGTWAPRSVRRVGHLGGDRSPLAANNKTR